MKITRSRGNGHVMDGRHFWRNKTGFIASQVVGVGVLKLRMYEGTYLLRVPAYCARLKETSDRIETKAANK